ncbi:plasmid partitioning protein RepB [Breoghania sp. JC706]|uniref:plasmid partitioning protein RepB n=1 Tax=Breoghania sp. JC706 TaxID=3117732 RepID=UPI003008D15F
MSKRKDVVEALFAGVSPSEDMIGAVAPEATHEGHGESAADAGMPQRRLQAGATGAVRAVGLSLDALAREAEEGRRLRESLREGERVVDLDPAMIEGSILADRLGEPGPGPESGSRSGPGDADFAALKASIAANGQQVPVLVRPHPDADKARAGYYQTACGHRRIRAARELSIPVRAIVRQLDDRALLVAQGNENAARRDLSYIERARFARAIIAGGFDRHTAQAALSVDKTEMSRMLQVAEGVPDDIVRAIGPAPRAGRQRWLALGALLKAERADLQVRAECATGRFRQADSDARFQLLLNRLAKMQRSRAAAAGEAGPASGALSIADAQGRRVAFLSRGARRTRIELDGADHRAFADYLAGELPRLAEAFRAARGG